MSSQKGVRVIFDTNIWISFLIGKKLSFIADYIAGERIKVVISTRLLDELQEVTTRPKLSGYFDKNKVTELIRFLEFVGEIYETEEKITICRDPEDNFLLDLILVSRANYLVTGDKDLLSIAKFQSTKIISPTEFERRIRK